METEQRKIIHIDMDAFFASVEQLDNPELRGRPIAVGGSSDRGVVAAASYEARKFGVRSAMASKIALRKCPQLTFVRPRFERYREISIQIQQIFHEYTDLVEPLSLDEAFLDVTNHKKGRPSATLIANEIRQRIKDEIGLTASAGISYNKFLAKIASDYEKPDGYFVITPKEAEEFIANLEIGRFFGVGKKTAKRFHQLGVHFGRELRQIERIDLVREFGKAGSYYYDIARGTDYRAVVPNRERKSIGAERTFHDDIFQYIQVKEEIEKITDIVWERIQKKKSKGKTLTIKVKFSDFEQKTRSKTFSHWVKSKKEVYDTSIELMPFDEISERGTRLLGITLSNLQVGKEENNTEEAIQLKLDL